ncbi:MAG: hypothetical protein AAF244_01100 [Pseudomonadota bacterium]
MNFVRTLSEEEILDALKKGKARADFFLSQAAEDLSSLEENYKKVLDAVDHAENNFSLEGYAHRNDIYADSGDKVSESSLRRLFLSAVTLVECLENIEPTVQQERSKSPSILIGSATDRHIELIKAANIFRTDGKNDNPAYDIGNIIQTFRGHRPPIVAQ